GVALDFRNGVLEKEARVELRAAVQGQYRVFEVKQGAAPPSFRIELVEIALQTTAIPRRQFRGASLRIGERSRDFRSVARQRAPESRWNEALFFQTPQERGDG